VNHFQEEEGNDYGFTGAEPCLQPIGRSCVLNSLLLFPFLPKSLHS
jgi:hypothetical protein